MVIFPIENRFSHVFFHLFSVLFRFPPGFLVFWSLVFHFPPAPRQVLISTLGESKETSTAVNQRVKAAEEAAVELGGLRVVEWAVVWWFLGCVG